MTRRKHKTLTSDAKPQAAECDRLRPWLLGGMTALLVARPLFPSESAAFHGDGLSVVMLWIALGVFWLLGAIGRPTFSLRFGWTDAAVLLLVVWTTVASLFAAHNGTPRPAINMLWEWVGMALCFLLARQFIVTSRERRAVVAVMVAVAVAISGYGLYQRCYELPQTRAIYQADPEQAMREAGMWYPANSPERKAFEDRLANTEPMATFALTNSLAAFLTPWLVMLAGIAVVSMQNRKRLLAMLVCLVPIAVCLLLTKSRSGYAGVCVGVLLAWLLSRERRIRIGWKLPVTLGGIAAVLLSIALAVEGSAVVGRATKSFGYRLQYWQSSLQMIADHPWVGCGPGNFQATYTQYKLPEASEEIADPHNFLLEICATAGIPAALAFLAVLGCFALNGKQAVAHETLRSDNPDAWLFVLVGGAVGFVLSVPLAMLSAAPPGVAPVLLGLPLAAATVVLLLGWIREGRLPRWLPGVCVAAMLVNLLAAGGIAMPGVAGTFWLLLALGLDDRQPHTFRTTAAWIALAGFMALSLTCYQTAYNPAINCQAEMRLAERNPERALEHLKAAAAADPLSAEPWRQLAAIEFEAWQRAPIANTFDRFESSDAKALLLAPNSASAWLNSGEWHFQASTVTDLAGKKIAENSINKAVDAYRRAAQLYPNSALHRAKLAEASLAAGDQSAFQREAETALRLDQATPHLDKKLPAELRDRLRLDLKKSP